MRTQRSFGQIPRITSEMLAKATIEESSMNLNGSFFPTCLATDSQGRHYFKFAFSSDALLIMNFTNLEHSLLKLNDEMQDKIEERHRNEDQSIKDLFLNENRVIIVTYSGCSIWQWHASNLSFISYISNVKDDAYLILRCSFANNALIVSDNISAKIVDFNETEPAFFPIIIPEANPNPDYWRLSTVEGRHCFYNDGEQPRELTVKKNNEGQWSVSISQDFLIPSSSNVSQYPKWSIEDLEYESFTVSTGKGTFWVTYLENLYNFKSEVLTNLLNTQRSHLYWVQFIEPENNLKVLYRTVTSKQFPGVDPFRWQHTFTVLTIPLISENKNTDSSRQDSLPSSSTSYSNAKIVFAAGAIFLTLALIATAVLIVYHPGTVIYKGSGIILTLPAVLTLSIGGSLGLTTVAVGSYLWWKQQRA